MIDSFARLFPTWYKLPPRERAYEQEVIVNWLDMEVECDAPSRMPMLNELRSWRNREVYYFIADGWDWTRTLFETGQYFPKTDDAPERFRRTQKQPPKRGQTGAPRRHVPLVVSSYLSTRRLGASSQRVHNDGPHDQTSCLPPDKSPSRSS